MMAEREQIIRAMRKAICDPGDTHNRGTSSLIAWQAEAALDAALGEMLVLSEIATQEASDASQEFCHIDGDLGAWIDGDGIAAVNKAVLSSYKEQSNDPS